MPLLIFNNTNYITVYRENEGGLTMLWKMIEKKKKKQGISILKLSKLTGIPDTTLHNYKNGSEPSFKNMERIADVLDVSLDVFRERR